MPLNLPPALLLEKNKIATDSAWLALLDIKLSDEENLHFVNNNEDIIRSIPDGQATFTRNSTATYYDSSENHLYAYPSSWDLIVGELLSGGLSGLLESSEDILELQEKQGVPGYEIIFDFDLFQNRDCGLRFVGRYHGSPSHVVNIQLWNYLTSTWVNVHTLNSSVSDETFEIDLIGNYRENHKSRVRFYHSSPGNPNHRLFIQTLQAQTLIPLYSELNGTLIGINEPRYKEGGGIFVEESTTNILTNPIDLSSASWPAVSGVKNVVQSSYLAPDGELTAWDITDPDTSNYHGIGQDHAIAVDTAMHFCHIYVRKTTGGNSPTFGINFSMSGGTGVNTFVRLNTDTGQLGGSGAARAMVAPEGDWWRVDFWLSNNNTNNLLRFQIYAATNTHGLFADSPIGVGTATVWHPQCEKKPYATTFISGTRPNEVATITPTDPVISDASAFAVETDVVITSLMKSATTRMVWRLCQSDDPMEDFLFYSPDTGLWRLLWRTGGETHQHNVAQSLIPDGLQRLAVRRESGMLSLWCGGIKIAEVAAPTFPSSFARMDVGHNAGQCQPNTFIGPIRFSSRARTDAELAYTGPLKTDDDTTALLNFNNNLNIYKGKKYTAFPFELDVQKSNNTGEIPQITLQVSNITRIIQAYLEKYDGGVGAEVTITPINSKHLEEDYSPLELHYQVMQAKSDAQWVYFTLGMPNPMMRRFPLDRYIATHCNWVTNYKGAECRYSGPIETCNGTLEDCKVHNNSHRFGGFQGLSKIGIRFV